MPLTAGQTLSLSIDRPAAGGRMIARADGQIVLVAGAIPGERVTAQIERVRKDVAYASTVHVDEPSADRRTPSADPACGGCLYAHIAYARQLEIKALIVADAFRRLARMPLELPVPVAASPEEGYRMRARLHVKGGRFGFFREGTHDLCDVRATRQLLPATCDVLDRVAARVRSLGADLQGVELSENSDASERVLQFASAGRIVPGAEELSRQDGLTAGPYVTDVLTIGEADPIRLRRHVLAFFQGNRYLLPALVAYVSGEVPKGSDAIDLYAGSGLFSIGAATLRDARVTAVEGERWASSDLEHNAGKVPGVVRVVHQAVETFTQSGNPGASTIIVDPPRTGMSREAIDGVIRLQAERIVYVSCDVATLARDARTLVDAGFAVGRVEAFDLFPNTPHVETVVVFSR